MSALPPLLPHLTNFRRNAQPARIDESGGHGTITRSNIRSSGAPHRPSQQPAAQPTADDPLRNDHADADAFRSIRACDFVLESGMVSLPRPSSADPSAHSRVRCEGGRLVVLLPLGRTLDLGGHDGSLRGGLDSRAVRDRRVVSAVGALARGLGSRRGPDTLVPGGARVDTGPLALDAVALLEHTGVVVGRLVPHAAHDVVDVRAPVLGPRTGTARTEAVLVGRHEVLPLGQLLPVASEGTREDVATDGVARASGAVRVELSALVTGADVDLGKVTSAGDLDEGRRLEEVSALDGAVGDETGTVARLHAVGDHDGLEVTHSVGRLGVGRAPETEVLDRVDKDVLALGLGVRGTVALLAVVVASLTALGVGLGRHVSRVIGGDADHAGEQGEEGRLGVHVGRGCQMRDVREVAGLGEEVGGGGTEETRGCERLCSWRSCPVGRWGEVGESTSPGREHRLCCGDSVPEPEKGKRGVSAAGQREGRGRARQGQSCPKRAEQGGIGDRLAIPSEGCSPVRRGGALRREAGAKQARSRRKAGAKQEGEICQNNTTSRGDQNDLQRCRPRHGEAAEPPRAEARCRVVQPAADDARSLALYAHQREGRVAHQI
ncbi:hypothetical protein L1887_53031 [Cichorium endivia]|nr:hypothetical protein L1887_53031 [Cichorium endivia]